MRDEAAQCVVSDDILVSLTGKLTLIGVYTGDIVIPQDGMVVNQLAFFINVTYPRRQAIKITSVKVKFPGHLEPYIITVPPLPQVDGMMERKTATVRFPFLMQQLVLSSGKVEIAVVHEKGEIDAGALWITLAPPPRTH